ncbi:unnamed protein product [Schistocephalus solidus]|uniref:Uncharacterized protein n=1 Tax=Schistocephalus solidus TaxID=70667 RepID=A0A183SRI5_SCHSO|nr:unnamed protein product [Schistocephalus solidus]
MPSKLGCGRVSAVGRAKSSGTTRLSSTPSPDLDGRFSHFHLDILVPLHLSNGFIYLLTSNNHITRWPKTIPLRDFETATAIPGRKFATFGALSIVTTGCGAQF